MAISRAAAAAVAGNTILAASWEAEFNNIINNALALVSPWTGNMDAGNFRLIDLNLGTVGDPAVRFEGDANTGIYSSAADTVDIATGGSRAASFGAQALILAAPEDARTATVDVAQVIRSTTSGVPAANIGVGLQFDAESADENPSTFGRIDFVATDVTAASEDTVMDILLRVAGAAEEIKYRFVSTAAAGFQGTFAHAVTEDRTWTLPDITGTLSLEAILDRSATDVTVVSTTTETSLYSFTVTGGVLGTSNRIRVNIFGVVTDTGDVATLTLRFKYGATTLITITDAAVPDTSTGFFIEFSLAGDTATNAQLGVALYLVSGAAQTITRGTAAIDSTANQTLDVTAQWDAATANRTITKQYAMSEVLRLP